MPMGPGVGEFAVILACYVELFGEFYDPGSEGGTGWTNGPLGCRASCSTILFDLACHFLIDLR